VLRQLDGAQNANASLVEGLIRLKNARQLKNPEAAFAAFRKSGELGAAYGRFYTGLCYEVGFGVKKNRKTAERRYLDSAGNGCISAMFALGKMYRLGEGVEQDVKLGLGFYRRAANARVPFKGPGAGGHCESLLEYINSNEKEVQSLAQEQMGTMYQDGSYGVPQDLAESRRWFRSAATNGSSYAKQQLRKLPRPPLPVPPTLERPVGLPILDTGGNVNGIERVQAYLLAQKHRGAQPPNYKLAARYFFIANQQGHPEANQELDAIKAEIGDEPYSLLFRVWNPAHRPEE
jgi:TPR repeat protein